VTTQTPRNVRTAIDSTQHVLQDMQVTVQKMLVTAAQPMRADVELLVGFLRTAQEEIRYAQSTFPTVATSLRSEANDLV